MEGLTSIDGEQKAGKPRAPRDPRRQRTTAEEADQTSADIKFSVESINAAFIQD